MFESAPIEPQPWYRSTPVLLLTSLLFPPLGLVLLLANPAANYIGINQTMSREQFSRLGPFSAVSLTHPDLTVPIADPAPIPPPQPVPPPPEALAAQIAAQQAYIRELETRLGVASVDYAGDLEGLARGVSSVAAALRALHPQPV